jgi:catechol 2,3-dioxygenase-like lactoylglutathione lyase family enzyme
MVARVQAQSETPAGLRVTMGHVHLNVLDAGRARHFWVGLLGGAPVKIGPGEAIRFPGVLVMLRESERVENRGESAVEYLGFRARDLPRLAARLEEGGVRLTRLGPSWLSVFTPEALRVDLYGFPSQPEAIRFHRVHFRIPDPEALRSWYQRTFGLRTTEPLALELPGATLTFAPAPHPPAPSQGRALDHISFEVRNLEAFCRQLERQGIQFDKPFRRFEKVKAAAAVLTDPSRMTVSLTEGLDAF